MAKSLLDANWTRIIDRIQQLGVQYGRTVKRIDAGIPAAKSAPNADAATDGNRWTYANGNARNAAYGSTVIGTPH